MKELSRTPDTLPATIAPTGKTSRERTEKRAAHQFVLAGQIGRDDLELLRKPGFVRRGCFTKVHRSIVAETKLMFMTGSTILGDCMPASFIATRDPKRAGRFYGETLGLRLMSQDDFALVFESGGATIRVATVRDIVLAPYTVLGWHVPDIIAVANRIAYRRREICNVSGNESG